MSPVCKVATAVKWMFKHWSEFLYMIRILLDIIFFLNHFSVPSLLIPVLSVVLAVTYCAINERTNVLDEE